MIDVIVSVKIKRWKNRWDDQERQMLYILVVL